MGLFLLAFHLHLQFCFPPQVLRLPEDARRACWVPSGDGCLLNFVHLQEVLVGNCPPSVGWSHHPICSPSISLLSRLAWPASRIVWSACTTRLAAKQTNISATLPYGAVPATPSLCNHHCWRAKPAPPPPHRGLHSLFAGTPTSRCFFSPFACTASWPHVG